MVHTAFIAVIFKIQRAWESAERVQPVRGGGVSSESPPPQFERYTYVKGQSAHVR
jgi:hypothetical protein